MADERVLFVQVGGDAHWTEDQIRNLTETIGAATPDDVTVVASEDSVQYLSDDEVAEHVENLVDALEG